MISIDLIGWTLVSERGDQRSVLTATISSGQTLRIWAASGLGFSCNLPGNIWNNSELDPAVLYNAQCKEVSRYPYLDILYCEYYWEYWIENQ